MNLRRYKTTSQQLVISLSLAVSVGFYLASLSANTDEDSTANVFPSAEANEKDRAIADIPINGEQVNIFRWVRNEKLPKKAAEILLDHKRIYFHETTGNGSLNLRQLCAVESAAKENPNRSVQIFFQTDKIELIGPLDLVLKKYRNIAVILINASDYFAETPLENWYFRGEWRKSPYKTEHFSDYIRILSLHKGGGMYMDLDFVTLKPFNTNIFWNFVPEEDDAYLTGSSFHFQNGHIIIKNMLNYLATSYHPYEWTYSGPKMIKKVVLKFCHKTSPKPTYPLADLCPGVRVLSKPFLYPYKYEQWRHFFRNKSSPSDKAFKSYAIHFYNKLSKRSPIYVGSNQIYSLVAREHCPVAYAQAGDIF